MGAASGHDPELLPDLIRQLGSSRGRGRGDAALLWSALLWFGWWQGQSRDGMGWDGGIQRANCFCIVINIGCMFFGSHWKGGHASEAEEEEGSPSAHLHGKAKGQAPNRQRSGSGAGAKLQRQKKCHPVA